MTKREMNYGSQSQRHYIDKILEKFNMSNSNVARTLVNVNLHLSNNAPVEVFSYNWEFDVLDKLYRAWYSLLSEQTEQVHE